MVLTCLLTFLVLRVISNPRSLISTARIFPCLWLQ